MLNTRHYGNRKHELNILDPWQRQKDARYATLSTSAELGRWWRGHGSLISENQKYTHQQHSSSRNETKWKQITEHTIHKEQPKQRKTPRKLKQSNTLLRIRNETSATHNRRNQWAHRGKAGEDELTGDSRHYYRHSSYHHVNCISPSLYVNRDTL